MRNTLIVALLSIAAYLATLPPVPQPYSDPIEADEEDDCTNGVESPVCYELRA